MSNFVPVFVSWRLVQELQKYCLKTNMKSVSLDSFHCYDSYLPSTSLLNYSLLMVCVQFPFAGFPVLLLRKLFSYLKCITTCANTVIQRLFEEAGTVMMTVVFLNRAAQGIVCSDLLNSSNTFDNSDWQIDYTIANDSVTGNLHMSEVIKNATKV